MVTVRITRILDRDAALQGFIRIRQQWQEAADGESLINVTGSVGLLLFDLVEAAGFLPDEVAQIMGDEIQALLVELPDYQAVK